MSKHNPNTVSHPNKVSHPQHYNTGKIEVIEYLEDKSFGFHLGNAVKYISRAGHKDPDKFVEDLEKAIWYLKRMIEVYNAENDLRPAIKPNNMNPLVEES